MRQIAATVKTPCIRKDFTVEDYMIYEAKVLGAKAVLLICSILEEAKIKEYINICDSLGISALVEAHDEREIEKALNSSARIVGVNNRNLKDFKVDTSNSLSLRNHVPKDVVFVSESGISSVSDVKPLKEMGVDAVLIGEMLMRSDRKKELIAQIKEA